MKLPGLSPPPNYVVDLREIPDDLFPFAGTKAGNLRKLILAGFRVPEGYVLLTGAFDRVMETNDLGSDVTQDVVLGSKIPEDVGDAIGWIVTKMGESKLAVRSSGTAEDLSDKSFAGQYETVLGVRGREELERAVLRCWASAFSPHVVEYRMKGKNGGKASMAVLIQKMVDAESAGVAFTANPVTTDREEVVINAVKGLGERLVSGQATPDEWVVKNNNPVCKVSSENSIGPEQAKEIAAVAKRVEEHFGSPQDIEWAVESGELFLLQARPITTLKPKDEQVMPIPIKVEVPEGYWMRDEDRFKDPISPMEQSLSYSIYSSMMRRICKDFGMPIEGADFRNIGGYVYFHVVPPGGKDRSPPPSWLMPILVRIVPQVRSMNRRCVDAVRNDKYGRAVDSWYNELRPIFKDRIEKASSSILPEPADEELEEHISATVGLYRELLEVHFRLAAAMSLPIWRFASFCQDSIGWDAPRIMEMLGSSTTIEPSRELSKLAKIALKNPDLLRTLESPLDEGAIEKIRNLDREFADYLVRYIREFGGETIGYDVSLPTIAEITSLIPNLIMEQARHQLGNSTKEGIGHDRENTVREARKVIGLKAQEKIAQFDLLFQRADRAYSTLDDSEHLLMICRGILRRSFLELGIRLLGRGVLRSPKDIFFLEESECAAALHGNDVDLLELVKKRKGEMMWAKAHPGPKSYGKEPPPPPSMKSFPKEVQDVMQSFIWLQPALLTLPKEKSEGTISGTGVSSGVYTGPVRLVMNESEFGKVRRGDVLVCPTTAPTWTLLFSNVGALVTDMGGLLSHPSIIAREYGIPAVVGTGNATKLLQDGQLVKVDGSRGEVILISMNDSKGSN